MKLFYSLLGVMFVISAFAGTRAILTKTININLVCENKREFMAFNFAEKRIWIGEVPYFKGVSGIELAKVFVSGRHLGGYFNYSGKIKDIGPQVDLAIAGTVYLKKLPIENVFNVEGASQPFFTFCKYQ